MALILTVLVIFALLVASELWWRSTKVHSEFSRKFVHIAVGSFVAFWPYFLSPNQIKLLSGAFIVAVLISQYLDIFKAIHSVQRPTHGEFWFALVVGLLAFVVHHPHIYTAALLEMSLADGLAALVGTRFGNGHRYSVLGSPKSMIGTFTFAVVSCAILAGYAHYTPGTLTVLQAVPIVLVATILENVGFQGLDNLLVPLFVSSALFLLAT